MKMFNAKLNRVLIKIFFSFSSNLRYILTCKRNVNEQRVAEKTQQVLRNKKNNCSREEKRNSENRVKDLDSRKRGKEKRKKKKKKKKRRTFSSILVLAIAVPRGSGSSRE